MTKNEHEATMTKLPVGEDPLEMAKQNENTSAPQNEQKAESTKKRPKRKRIPK